MKRLRITAAMAITALLLAGCDKEEQKLPDPIIKVDNEAVIELPPAGGTASFAYSIENSVENGYLTAEPSESDTWMSDFTITDSEVSFSVEANETEESREGTISLIYTYGENKTVNAVVNVSQQPGEEPVPTITITTEDPLTLAADGGSYTIEYEISDPTEDGSISADAGDAGWITDINCDTEGVITFSAAANDTDGERQAIVKVTYTYNGTETASDAITVSQQPGEEPVPTITITTEDPLTLAADGGSYTIEYEISDPTEDGSISADAGDAGWITDINCDTEGVITFSVAANDTDGERQATITVTYTYNGTETVSESIDAVQEANEPPVQGYDYEYVMLYRSIVLYPGSPNNYYIKMSSDPDGDPYGAATYTLDLYAESSSSTPPAGTYTITANGGADMTASSGYTSVKILEESGNTILNCKIAEGTITITYEGDTMIMDAVLTDVEGNTHHVTYNAAS